MRETQKKQAETTIYFRDSSSALYVVDQLSSLEMHIGDAIAVHIRLDYSFSGAMSC
jgi:hypothetical protein